MSHQTTARILLAIFCALQGAGTVAVDMNRTHAANPQWIGHARFHVVWQSATIVALTVFEIVLLFWQGRESELRFYAVAALAAIPPVGFFAAFLTRRIYGGTLSDPNGIPPLRIKMASSHYCVDMNLVVECAALAVLVALTLFFSS